MRSGILLPPEPRSTRRSWLRLLGVGAVAAALGASAGLRFGATPVHATQANPAMLAWARELAEDGSDAELIDKWVPLLEFAWQHRDPAIWTGIQRLADWALTARDGNEPHASDRAVPRLIELARLPDAPAELRTKLPALQRRTH